MKFVQTPTSKLSLARKKIQDQWSQNLTKKPAIQFLSHTQFVSEKKELNSILHQNKLKQKMLIQFQNQQTNLLALLTQRVQQENDPQSQKKQTEQQIANLKEQIQFYREILQQESTRTNQLQYKKATIRKCISKLKRQSNETESDVQVYSRYLSKANQFQIKSGLDLGEILYKLQKFSSKKQENSTERNTKIKKKQKYSQKVKNQLQLVTANLANLIVQQESRNQQQTKLALQISKAAIQRRTYQRIIDQDNHYIEQSKKYFQQLKQQKSFRIIRNSGIVQESVKVTKNDIIRYYRYLISTQNHLEYQMMNMNSQQNQLQNQLHTLRKQLQSFKGDQNTYQIFQNLKQTFTRLFPNNKPTISNISQSLNLNQDVLSTECVQYQRLILVIQKQLLSLIYYIESLLWKIEKQGVIHPPQISDILNILKSDKREHPDTPNVRGEFDIPAPFQKGRQRTKTTIRLAHSISQESVLAPPVTPTMQSSSMKQIQELFLGYFPQQQVAAFQFVKKIQEHQFVKQVIQRETLAEFFNYLSDEYSQNAGLYAIQSFSVLYQKICQRLSYRAKQCFKIVKMLFDALKMAIIQVKKDIKLKKQDKYEQGMSKEIFQLSQKSNENDVKLPRLSIMYLDKIISRKKLQDQQSFPTPLLKFNKSSYIKKQKDSIMDLINLQGNTFRKQRLKKTSRISKDRTHLKPFELMKEIKQVQKSLNDLRRISKKRNLHKQQKKDYSSDYIVNIKVL